MPQCRLAVKVVPNASRDQIVGWLGDHLKIRLQAPPEAGRANKRLCQTLAQYLGLPGNAVTIASGSSHQRKIVEICGLDLSEVRHRLLSLSRPPMRAKPDNPARQPI